MWPQDVVVCSAGHEFKLARFLHKKPLDALEEAAKVRAHALPPHLGVSLRAVRETGGSACLMATDWWLPNKLWELQSKFNLLKASYNC